MKPFWLMLHLQTVYIICRDESLNLRAQVKYIFSFDVKYPFTSDGVELLIWQVTHNQQKLTLQRFYSICRQVPQFESTETYIVLSLVPNSDLRQEGYSRKQAPLNRFIVYYWVGTIATLANKQIVAKYAIQLYSSMRQYYWELLKISLKTAMNRELENLESESFKRTINLTVRKVPIPSHLTFYYQYLDSQFPTHRPNLYVVKGTEDTNRIKRIPLNGKWLKNNVCLIMESGLEIDDLPPIMIYCGNETPFTVQDRARIFSTSFRPHYEGYRNGEVALLFNNSKGFPKFKAFIEVFENPSYTENDHSEGHLEDAQSFVNSFDANMRVLKITSTITSGLNENTLETLISLEPVLRGPSWKWNLQHDEIYLLDTKSPAGVFLVLGQYDLLDDRIRAIQYAELYLQENYTIESKLTRMRIMDVNCGNKIKFSSLLIEFPWIMIDGLMQPHSHW